MTTIKDVANYAGVAVGTVSRVLSGNRTVKADTRARVETAIEALNYRPNLAARAMRTKRIQAIGLLVPDISNPFFAQIARDVEVAAAEHDHSVMLANSHDDPAHEAKQLAMLAQHAPRGIIVAAVLSDIVQTAAPDVPIFSIDRRFADRPLASVDHRRSSEELGRYIVSLGHSRIGYVSGPLTKSVAQERAAGFAAGVEAASGGGATLLRLQGDFSFASGEALGRQLLTGSQPPTAIIGANDQIAIGIMRAARDMGLSLPQDLSVAGFDDIQLAALVAPRLTTVRQPTEALARQTVQAMIQGDAPLQDLTLKGELIKRRSTGPV